MKLSEKEYELAVIEAYKTKSFKKATFLAFNLSIDYRLGLDFSNEKRILLWNAKRKIDKKMWTLIFYAPFKKLLEKRSNELTKLLISEFSKILNKDELDSFIK